MATVPTERINRRRTVAFTILVSVSLVLMAISSNPYVREVQNGVGFAFRPIQGALDNAAGTVASIGASIA
jgi:hypothetical protein